MSHERLPLRLAIVAVVGGFFCPRLPAETGGARPDAAARQRGAVRVAAEPVKAVPEDPLRKAAAHRPACMHCGATCGLVAVCVCTPGTRKTPKTEYEAACDPVCVPRCGGPPWPWGGHRPVSGCTGCEAECCDAWVRRRKKLVKETFDEERPVVERKVAYVCRDCGPGAVVGCTGGGDSVRTRSGWWPTWLPNP